jgi:hypothetical protein
VKCPSDKLRSQRWRERRAIYRPDGEVFDPKQFGVELVREREARPFVERHHYSGSYPAARLAAGLMRSREGWFAPELVGVAVFSVPAQPQAIRAHLGVEPAQGVELGRFVLLDEIPSNAETWFLARARRLLHAELPAVRGILSYSDPLERRTAAGLVVKPGHVGQIYRDSGAAYLGRSSSRTLLLTPDGRALSGRTLSKIRLGERGCGAAIDALVRLGLPPAAVGEDGAAWLARALTLGEAQGLLRRLPHPGNHVYRFAVHGPTPSALPYPKKEHA